MPGYCRVLGVVRPAINFEARLPASNWNGKFYMAGCGGLCGTLDSDRPGFGNADEKCTACAVTTRFRPHLDLANCNTAVTDGRWAFNNRIAENDWGWRAVTETSRVTKLLIKALYNRSRANRTLPGARQVVAWQRWRRAFPERFRRLHFRGTLLSDYTGLVATSVAWKHASQYGLPHWQDDWRNCAKVRMIGDAVRKACGNADGLYRGPDLGAVSCRSNCSARPVTRRTA